MVDSEEYYIKRVVLDTKAHSEFRRSNEQPSRIGYLAGGAMREHDEDDRGRGRPGVHGEGSIAPLVARLRDGRAVEERVAIVDVPQLKVDTAGSLSSISVLLLARRY